MKKFGIHLTTLLFPEDEPFWRTLKNKIKNDLSGDIIFYCSKERKEEWVKKIEEAKKKIPQAGNWNVELLHGNRATAEKRAKKIIPIGKVSSEEIDAALSYLSEYGGSSEEW
jgi:hypothetical protein